MTAGAFLLLLLCLHTQTSSGFVSGFIGAPLLRCHPHLLAGVSRPLASAPAQYHTSILTRRLARPRSSLRCSAAGASDNIDELRKEMELAISEERYGDAAKLRDAIKAAAPALFPVPKNFWCLTDGSTEPSEETQAMCKEFLALRKAGEEAASKEVLLGTKGVCIEVDDVRGSSYRRFLLPRGVMTTVRETSFGSGGLGYSVWEAGVALSTWLAMNCGAIKGKRVLELGSGVGISGLSCALAGADFVVLTDFGKPREGEAVASVGGNKVVSEDIQPPDMMQNLEHNVALNRLGATCEIQRLDWHAPPPEGGGDKFEVVIGSDLCYYEEDAGALARTVIRATAPGGKFLLMNRVGTDKRSAALEKVLSLLAEAGSVERNNMRVTDAFGAHPLVFAIYTAPGRGGGGGGGGGEVAGGRGPSMASLQDLRQRELRRLRDVDPGGDNMATPF